HIVYNNGTALMTFTSAPPYQQWSTRNWAGGAGDALDAASFDTLVKTNSASIITNALASTAGNPPAAGATGTYASDAAAQYLETRPTGVAYEGIMATLTNAGGSVNGIGVTYTYTASTLVDEVIL